MLFKIFVSLFELFLSTSLCFICLECFPFVKDRWLARAQCRRFLVMFENFNTPESTIPCNNLSFAVHRCWMAIINIQYMIHWLWSLRLLHILHNLFVCNHWMLRSLTSFYSWPVKDIRCDVLGKLASEVK